MKTHTIPTLAIVLGALLLPACTSTDSPATTSAGSGIKRYPLRTCIVSDNELGSMGEIITKTYGSQEVKFCCKPCVKKFEANPAKFLAKLP